MDVLYINGSVVVVRLLLALPVTVEVEAVVGRQGPEVAA